MADSQSSDTLSVLPAMIRIIASANGISCGTKVGTREAIGHPFRDGTRSWKVVVKCDCGDVCVMSCYNLERGIRCKCQKSNFCERDRRCKHGKRGTRLYRMWKGMNTRCNWERSEKFANYGGRGISVCPEWKSFVVFENWAIENGYKQGLQLDRINNDGNYEPGNCRWTTSAVQNRNKRTNRLLTAFSETKCLVDWADDSRCVVTEQVLRDRIKLGWDHHRAITVPAKSARPGLLT